MNLTFHFTCRKGTLLNLFLKYSNSKMINASPKPIMKMRKMPNRLSIPRASFCVLMQEGSIALCFLQIPNNIPDSAIFLMLRCFRIKDYYSFWPSLLVGEYVFIRKVFLPWHYQMSIVQNGPHLYQCTGLISIIWNEIFQKDRLESLSSLNS